VVIRNIFIYFHPIRQNMCPHGRYASLFLDTKWGLQDLGNSISNNIISIYIYRFRKKQVLKQLVKLQKNPRYRMSLGNKAGINLEAHPPAAPGTEPKSN
jgi:hypothetical protein